MKHLLHTCIITIALLSGLAASQGVAQCPPPGTSHPAGATGNYGDTTIMWDEVDDAMYYQLWMTRDGKVFHREWFMGDTEWTSDGPLFAGEYSFWIRTRNPCGFGNWSTGFSFSVDCDYQYSPWPRGPNGDTYDLQYDGEFEWGRSMPQATWYNIWVERDGAHYLNEWRAYGYGYDINDAGYEISTDELGGPLPCGSFSWKIRSWSACGGTTDWSSSYDFTVNCCTSAPVEIENVTIREFWGYGLAVLDPRPLIEWDDMGDATWYNLEIHRNGRPYIDEWTRDAEWESKRDMPPGEYFIDVRGWNPCGLGTWGLFGHIITVECSTATAPLGPREVFGYGYGYGRNDAVLRWNDQSGVYWYNLAVRRDGVQVYNRWLDLLHPEHPIQFGNVISAYPDVLNRHGDYSWQVRAWNQCGTSPWSVADTYSIDCELTKPMLTGPTGTVTDPRPLAAWNYEDQVDAYRIYVQRNGAKYVDLTLDDWDSLAYTKDEVTNAFDVSSGTGQGWQDDDSYWSITLPFGFPFFGVTQSVVYVNSNGALHFGEGSAERHANLDNLRDMTMIAVLWDDLRTDGSNNPTEDIYVETEAGEITVRWQAETYDGGYGINCSVTLESDGAIRLSYGAGNDSDGIIGLSAGDGTRFIGVDTTGSMDHADDIVFAPTGMSDQVGARPDWNWPNGNYRWWLQPRSDCFGQGPWSDAGQFTIDLP